ncbi:hypothetical protein CC85DRAFT_197949 [Cutaneotrichosporon oleaginosum]|uniref:Uncharacterized protein n=1 Tax=Cutaneotrichosporon oleaginosum TaxID=879819 RepID=A0A0J0XE77_9TREE|nr:uncharacterized protein CC85DRAFT_197949 [Cutaneotrichosporon oleaginosum]KLT39333.1 hypothetical protein CC85DRAFT_197949 [Cutaneotrichosporon oleaginosum]TXT08529.1 hypothetical protein COLE_05453 [Cutaneotrichosporon oleaginosum]
MEHPRGPGISGSMGVPSGRCEVRRRAARRTLCMHRVARVMSVATDRSVPPSRSQLKAWELLGPSVGVETHPPSAPGGGRGRRNDATFVEGARSRGTQCAKHSASTSPMHCATHRWPQIYKAPARFPFILSPTHHDNTYRLLTPASGCVGLDASFGVYEAPCATVFMRRRATKRGAVVPGMPLPLEGDHPCA